MCKCVDRRKTCENKDESKPNQSFPKILLALIDLERKAREDYDSVEDALQQIGEMQTILGKLTVTHIDSDNYANYLFQRAEQLSLHLETYKQIIGKIDIGAEIESSFAEISKKFIDYLREKLTFKTIWVESLEMIELGKRIAEKMIVTLAELCSLAKNAYDTEKYFDLREVCQRCHQEMAHMETTMENCLKSGKSCKEFGGHLYEKLTELEMCFQRVVRLSMDRINEMKRTQI